jgi:hypothetical protein
MTSYSRKFMVTTCFAVAGMLAIPSLGSTQEATSKDEVFSATASVALPKGAKIQSFDISYVDPTIHTYVLGDRTNKSVDVIDTVSLKATILSANPPFAGVGASNAASGPDGVIIVHSTEVWAGDAPAAGSGCPLTATSTVPQVPADPRCSTVKVINLASGNTTHVIPTGGLFRADEMCLDTADNLVMVANNADNPPFGSIISTTDYTVKHQISFTNSTNGAEQCQWSPRTGKFYITIPGVNAAGDEGLVEVIDPKTGTIAKTFPIPLNVCSTPQGLAVGPDKQIMVGCNGNNSGNGLASGIIINENSGSVIGVIPNEAGPDEVYYNEGDGQYFLARSGAAGSNQLLGVVDANGHRGDQSVVTADRSIAGRSAHSVAADSGTNKIFVPIPAGVSTICDPTTTETSGQNALGCVGVFTAQPDDNAKLIFRNSDD